MARAHAVNGTRTRQGIRARSSPCGAPVAGGSVRFWMASTDVPATVATMAKARPAMGCAMAAKVVTRTGPTMKTTSSTADSKAKAVCRSPLSFTTYIQRARMDDPIGGSPVPAAAAKRCGHGVGRPASTATIIATRPTPNTAAAAGSTRLCPSRSISLPIRMPVEALPTRNDAATAPAAP